jgi:putative sporulation protein YyaC
MSKKILIDSMSNHYLIDFNNCLHEFIFPVLYDGSPLIILCIGTDRSTRNIYTYGNLKHPVHAKNLTEVLHEINSKFCNPYIIAIDACLGSINNVGKIIIEDKPLSPGAALKKNLPKVGNLSITGIVNISTTLDFMVLQNTRLFTVMNLANAIAKGINYSIMKTNKSIKVPLNINELF